MLKKIKEHFNFLITGYKNEKLRNKILIENMTMFPLVNEDINYLKQYLGKYSLQPVKNVHVLLNLPFYAPLPDGDLCYCVVSGGIAIAFKYSTSNVNDNSQLLPPGAPLLITRGTNLEIIFHFFNEKSFNKSQEDGELAKLLDFALPHINDFILWVSVASNDYRVKFVSFENLGAVLPIRMTDSNYNPLSKGIFFNLREPNEIIKKLAQEDVKKFFSHINKIILGEKDELRFVYTLYTLTEGYRLISEGDHSSGVILVQTGVEALLNVLLDEINIIDGTSYSFDTFAKLFKNGFTSTVKGNWALDGKSVPGIYWEKCYELRGVIVHTGKRPSYWEAKNAYFSAENFLTFLKIQMYAIKKYRPILDKIPNINAEYIKLFEINETLEDTMQKNYIR